MSERSRDFRSVVAKCSRNTQEILDFLRTAAANAGRAVCEPAFNEEGTEVSYWTKRGWFCRFYTLPEFDRLWVTLASGDKAALAAIGELGASGSNPCVAVKTMAAAARLLPHILKAHDDLAGKIILFDDAVEQPLGEELWGLVSCRRRDDGTWELSFAASSPTLDREELEVSSGISDVASFIRAFLDCGVDYGQSPDVQQILDALGEFQAADPALAKQFRDWFGAEEPAGNLESAQKEAPDNLLRRATIAEIAFQVGRNWQQVDCSAAPYLAAMSMIDAVSPKGASMSRIRRNRSFCVSCRSLVDGEAPQLEGLRMSCGAGFGSYVTAGATRPSAMSNSGIVAYWPGDSKSPWRPKNTLSQTEPWRPVKTVSIGLIDDLRIWHVGSLGRVASVDRANPAINRHRKTGHFLAVIETRISPKRRRFSQRGLRILRERLGRQPSPEYGHSLFV